ncbi:hypothetical protein [Cellvibrio sp.]
MTNLHRDYRLTQTIAIVNLLAVIWLGIQINRPAEQFHYANFGTQAQLVSATPAATRIKPGQPIKFTVKWWLSAPLPPNHNISYYVRNHKHELGRLDTNSIKSTSIKFTDIPADGILFTDELEIPTRRNIPPGIYEVVAFIFPPDDFKINPARGSAIYEVQRTIFNIEARL